MKQFATWFFDFTSNKGVGSPGFCERIGDAVAFAKEAGERIKYFDTQTEAEAALLAHAKQAWGLTGRIEREGDHSRFVQ